MFLIYKACNLILHLQILIYANTTQFMKWVGNRSCVSSKSFGRTASKIPDTVSLIIGNSCAGYSSLKSGYVARLKLE